VRTTVAVPVARPGVEVGDGLAGVVGGLVAVDDPRAAAALLVATLDVGTVGTVGTVGGVDDADEEGDVAAVPTAGLDAGVSDEQAAAERLRATVAARATRVVWCGMRTSAVDASEAGCAPPERREQSRRTKS
jgi:hypothetical protein